MTNGQENSVQAPLIFCRIEKILPVLLARNRGLDVVSVFVQKRMKRVCGLFIHTIELVFLNVLSQKPAIGILWRERQQKIGNKGTLGR